MINTEKFGTPDSPKKGSKLGEVVRNAAMVALLGFTTLGTPSCNGEKNPKENPTGFVEKKPSFSGVSVNNRAIDGEMEEKLEGIMICEDPNTGKVFLSDGENKLTDDFDDIREIGLFDGTLYYIGVNAGKPVILNGKGDIIFSGLDEIESYAIHNGDIAVIGKKGGKSCLMFNGKIIDEGKDYYLWVENNWIFTIATYFNEDDDRVMYGYVDNRKVGPESIGCHREGSAYCGGSHFSGNGDGWTYFAESDKGNDPRITIIYDGIEVGSNLRNVLIVDGNNGIYSYVGEDGKNYILSVKTRRHYLIDREISTRDGKESMFFVNDGKRSYYLSNGKLYKFNGLNNLLKPEDAVYFSSKKYANGSIISLEVYNDTDFDPKYYNLFNGKLIGDNANIVEDDSEKISCDDGKGGNIVLNNKLNLIIHEKDLKNYIEYNGEDYILETSIPVPDSNNSIHIHSLEKAGKHYYLFDGKLYESYDISNIGMIDGKVYFLLYNPKAEEEIFVFDGKEIGRLMKIREVRRTKDGTIYLVGRETIYSLRGLPVGGKSVTSINGTVRETIHDNNSETLVRIE